VEDTDKSQGCGKFPQVRKLLPMIYSKLQPYSKTIERTKRQERLEMRRGTAEGI